MSYSILNQLNNEQDKRNLRVLVLYHDNCIDGYTAAWAAHKGLIEVMKIPYSSITIAPTQYGESDAWEIYAKQYDYILVVDFSLPIPTLQYMEDLCKVVIIDHHKSAAEMYGATTGIYGADIYMNMLESGASLTWQVFFPQVTPPLLIKYVKDYDLWLHNFSDCHAINKYLSIQPKTLDCWYPLVKAFNSDAFIDIKQIAYYLQKQHESIVADLVKLSEPIELAGEKGRVVNCPPHFANDVAAELALESGTYGATWYQGTKGRIKFSLRSEKSTKYNVRKIAEAFGGGGHDTAAGFILSAPSAGEMFPDEDNKLGVSVWLR